MSNKNVSKKEFICIGCPMGCPLTAEIDGNEIAISGNACKIGKDYGVNECTNPRRTITTSIRILDEQGNSKMVSVKTDKDIPKSMIFDCIKEIKAYNHKKGETFNVGQIIIENILDTGANVVATRQLK